MRTLFKWIPLLAAVLTLTGCTGAGSIYSNYREVARLQVIQTLGIDLEGEDLRVTISSGSSQQEPAPVLISVTAPSITLAFDQLRSYAAAEELFYAHVKYVLIGEAAARAGIAPYLDYIERSTELRQNLDVFVVMGGTARDLITGGKADYDISNIMPALVRDAERNGASTVLSCSDITRLLARQGACTVCAVRAGVLKDKVYTAEEGTTARVEGHAILQDGRLIGHIGDEAARGVNLLQNRAGIGSTALPGGDGEDAVTVTFDVCKTEISPRWTTSGELEAIEVDCTLEAVLAESAAAVDLEDKAAMDALGSALAEKIRGWMEQALRLSQETGADFLGLGRSLELKAPVAFDKIRDRWPALLETVDIRVTAKATVEGSYDLTSSPNTEGGGPDNVTGS